MIDFHSHILPNIDDGSSSIQESLQMLAALRSQEAGIVIATPHFYASEQSPEYFLFRRRQAYEMLCERMPSGMPDIFLGAEVLYYPGISRTKELPQLCVEGTNLLLLEMPFVRWSSTVISEVLDIACSREFKILLAHIERYYHQLPSVWDRFLYEGIYMQANAEFFLHFRTKRKALRLLREKRIHVLGSDCHNMSSRPPRLAEARSVIQHSLEPDILSRIDRTASFLLSHNTINTCSHV